jgi:hypothetical protein
MTPCPTCHGTGYETYDALYVWTCSDCIEMGQCPRCGRRWPTSDGVMDLTAPCVECGFVFEEPGEQS